MEMQKRAGKMLYGAASSGKISFHAALKLFRLISLVTGRKRTPASRFMRWQILRHIIEATAISSKAAWTSVLFPTEILYPFGIKPLTLEVIVGIFSTFGISPAFLDSADAQDVPKTMCSFHRALFGLSKINILKKPVLAGATSILCDGNVKSFAEIAREHEVPFLFIDVPFEENDDGIKYVKDQLESAIGLLSKSSGLKYRREMLNESIINSNKAIKLAKEFYRLRKASDKNVFVSHEQANFSFPMHFLLGSGRLVRILAKCCDAMKGGRTISHRLSPLRLMWLHIVPQYRTKIWDIIDSGVRARVVCDEYSNPYFDEYDTADPLSSIAARLIRHPSNGPVSRRIDHIIKVAREFKVDGIVHYSSWGCHQAAGNIELLGKAVRDAGYLFLNLNGDAVDYRNSSFEQHRTRLEALVENS